MNKKGYILSGFNAGVSYPHMFGETGQYEMNIGFTSGMEEWLGGKVHDYEQWTNKLGSTIVGVYCNSENSVRLYFNSPIYLQQRAFESSYIQFYHDYGGVYSFGDFCFQFCNQLSGVSSWEVQTIGVQCFRSSYCVGSFYFPECTVLGQHAFSYSLISEIVLPKVDDIGQYCFYFCTNLFHAEFPLLKKVSNYAFQGCINLNQIYFPILEEAGIQSFYQTRINYVFPELKIAGSNCFDGCVLLNINFPKLISAGESCFYGCSGTAEVYLPSCIDLGGIVNDNNVFYGITGKTLTLTVPSYLMTCNGGQPDGDIQWLQANNTVTVNQIEGLELEFDNIANVPVADPANVGQWNTFFDLPNLGTPFLSVVIIGNTVVLYGAENISLKQNLFNNNSHLISVNDQIECVSVILDSCFYQCVKLNFVSFDNCTVIGSSSFNSCYVLPQVSFPNVITAGNNAFFGCNLLNEASFPKLESAGDGTFSYCPLSVVDFSSLKNAGTSCFGYSNVSMSAFPVLENAGLGCFWNSSVGGDLVFPKLVTIGRMCFYNRTGSITEINIPACINLGGSSTLNDVFGGISGKTITLTISAALMTCNGGNPDGDITDLQSRNTVTIYQTNIKYGALYNWYAVSNVHGLAPDGWHVPTETEFSTLAAYLAPSNPPSLAGIYLKESGITHWISPNTGNNSTGFTLLPGGVRAYSGAFYNLSDYAYLWSSADGVPGLPKLAYCRYARNINDYFMFLVQEKNNGMSVRFVRDNDTGWVEGEQLIDQDGNVYDTVRIGTQIWTVQNYACTKYKNGVSIPNITDNSAWQNDASGAYCWYNNDISNK